MDVVSMFGMINRVMMESGTRIKSMEKEPMSGQMVVATKASGKRITCTERVCIHGRMAAATKVNT